ncbi:efflux RND transporter permease subunit [Nostoc sp.]|uniref:efflux RND transporter permease subunit n=1 Tax=Nostoc sp. TaxID=1180 RepID=UPI003FA5A4A3
MGQRSYRVYVQADANYRRSPDDIRRLYVRSANNQMVPLSEVAKITPTTGPSVISHYNGFRAIDLQGREASGYSSGQAIQAMQQAVSEAATPGVGSDWIGTALFGGLLVATILSLLIVPVLYVIIKTLEDRFLKKKSANRSQPPSPDGNQDGQSRPMPTPVGDAPQTTNAHQHSSVIVSHNADDNRRNDSSN